MEYTNNTRKPNDATTYKTTHNTEFTYEQNTPERFDYNIDCYTLTNRHSSTSITIIYNITSTLNIDLQSDPIQRNRTAEIIIQTNLISSCSLTWNSVNRGLMTANTSGRQHYMRIITTTDRIYQTTITCTTPITGISSTRNYDITINTTLPPPPIICNETVGGIACDKVPPTIGIQTINTPFQDIMRANITCTDDIGCTTTFNYSYTNRTDCTQETYNRRESYNNLLTFNKHRTIMRKSIRHSRKNWIRT